MVSGEAIQIPDNVVVLPGLGGHTDDAAMRKHPVGEVVHWISGLAPKNTISACLHGVVVQSVEEDQKGLGVVVLVLVGSGEPVLSLDCGSAAFEVGVLVLCGDLELLGRDVGLCLVGAGVSAATPSRLSIGLSAKLVALGLILIVLPVGVFGRRKRCWMHSSST